MSSINSWYEQPLGICLSELENIELTQTLKHCFGQYLLQIGGLAMLPAIKTSAIQHRLIVNNNINQNSSTNFLQASYDALPIQNESVNTIIHWHSLETVSDPKFVLAESWRALALDGHLIIIGFNPWSLWGLKHLFNSKDFPWNLHFHSAHLICKWVSSVGGEIINAKSLFFRPPLANKQLLENLQWLEIAGLWLWPYMGGVFFLDIQKKTIPVTPIKLTWPWQVAVVDKALSPSEGSISRRG